MDTYRAGSQVEVMEAIYQQASEARSHWTQQGIKKADLASDSLYHPTVSCFPFLDFFFFETSNMSQGRVKDF